MQTTTIIAVGLLVAVVFFGLGVISMLRKLRKAKEETTYWHTQYEGLNNSIPKRDATGKFTKKVK